MNVVQDRVNEPLYVITPYYNPIRFKAREKHAERYAQHVIDAGACLYFIEAAFGEREFTLDRFASHKMDCRAPVIAHTIGQNKCRHDDEHRGEHRYIKLRVNQEIWYKENLINIALQCLPADAKYVAWIDADVIFHRPNWVGECIQQLQHYDFLQMFSHAQDLDPDYQVLGTRPSFMHQYLCGNPLPQGYYSAGHPLRYGAWSGLAWAARRKSLDKVGGLLDFAIHGGGDWHMAFALIGEARRSVRKDVHPGYNRMVFDWEKLCEKHIRRNVGVMTGSVAHYWHGKKTDRKYANRHKLLAETKFNPERDLKYNSQGLLELIDDGSLRYIKLRDGLRKYGRERNEDSIDL